ncbi:MAG: carboxypeptidase-like regulatory domain-containing protein [Propionibacteriales bacterium]|nr:carboxypeptidase-like regulatory domain-containing protein [Propionibacteriales bacterium]
MRRGIRIIVGALLGLALTVGLLVGVSSAALADATATTWVAGVITDANGTPIDGAVVTVFSIDQSNQRTVVARRTTHWGGKFVMRSVPVGTYSLLVTDPALNNAPTWLNTDPGAYVPASFTLTTDGLWVPLAMQPGLSISGTTTFDGVPQQGVRVCISQDVPCATTDATGAYTLRGIGEGYYKLVADPVGDQPYVRTFFPSYTESSSYLAGPYRIDAESAKNPWDFTLQSQPYIGGTVVTEAGAGIAGASVCLGESCVTTGADGRFRMNVDLGFHNFQPLNITAAGYEDNVYLIGAGMQDAVITMTASASTPPETPTEVTGTVPSISGKTKVGARLTVDAGAWGPAGVTLSYQWYRNGAKIKGATKSTYKLSWRDVRKKMSVKVTGTLDGYATVSMQSNRTKKVTWR